MTRYEKLKDLERQTSAKLRGLEKEREIKTNELESYCKRHRISFDGLETADIDKLKKIYRYFDRKYRIDWQGGLRCDDRGMRLYFWLDEDPHYLIFHLSSTSENICFSGSTSWIVRATSLEEKVNKIKQVKKDIAEIIKK